MLASLLHSNADRLGSQIALVHGERRLTHAELAEQVDRVAGGLVALGVEPGDNVLLILPNVPEFVLGFYAVARLGAGAVLLNVASKEHELTKAYEDCRPRAVITDRQVAGTCQAVATALGLRAQVVTIDDVPSSAIPFDSLSKGSAPELPELPDAATPLVYQYSSGSTGRPKRVARTHGQCLAEARLVPASLVFGLAHFVPRREFLPWTGFAVAAGFLLGALFDATGNLVAPIVAHTTVNAVNLRFLSRAYGV